MEIGGIGRIIFWSGGSLWIGRAMAQTEQHAHHAIQVSLGLSGDVQFSASDGPMRTYRSVFIPPDLPHVFKAPGKMVAQLFCAPESVLGKALLDRFGTGDIAALDVAEIAPAIAALHEAFDADAPDEELEQLALDALYGLSGTLPPRSRVDERIARAAAYIAERLAAPLTLEDVSDRVGLSPGRFRHLFVAETGISFRAYLLWTRLNRALELGFGGTSWTEAAHAANFADSAHLSRTTRRMYGLAPTSLRIEGSPVARQMSA